MKKVINETLKNEVYIDNVSIDKCYGIRNLNSGIIGFIHQEQFNHGDYVAAVMSPNGVTKGNTFCNVQAATLSGTIQAALYSRSDVFEFDTSNELLVWLADEVNK